MMDKIPTTKRRNGQNIDHSSSGLLADCWRRYRNEYWRKVIKPIKPFPIIPICGKQDHEIDSVYKIKLRCTGKPGHAGRCGRHVIDPRCFVVWGES